MHNYYHYYSTVSLLWMTNFADHTTNLNMKPQKAWTVCNSQECPSLYTGEQPYSMDTITSRTLDTSQLAELPPLSRTVNFAIAGSTSWTSQLTECPWYKIHNAKLWTLTPKIFLSDIIGDSLQNTQEASLSWSALYSEVTVVS